MHDSIYDIRDTSNRKNRKKYNKFNLIKINLIKNNGNQQFNKRIS